MGCKQLKEKFFKSRLVQESFRVKLKYSKNVRTYRYNFVYSCIISSVDYIKVCRQLKKLYTHRRHWSVKVENEFCLLDFYLLSGLKLVFSGFWQMYH